MRLSLPAAVLVGLLGLTGSVAAQERPPTPPGWSTGTPTTMLPRLRSPIPAPPVARGENVHADLSPGRAFLLSAVLPGAAQLALNQWRWPLYVVAEGGGWYGYLHYRSQGRDLRDAYRTLAWEIPRQGFGEERRDADFGYYERMAKWPASGAFDADGAVPGIQPESDPTTFNGSVWTLARDLFAVGDAADPGSESYRQALDYYEARAVPAELRWDWGGQLEEQERFGRLIRASDRGFQRATTLVGILMGNHLLSAVDGYLSARLRQRALPDARVRFLPEEGDAPGAAWIIRVEITRR